MPNGLYGAEPRRNPNALLEAQIKELLTRLSLIATIASRVVDDAQDIKHESLEQSTCGLLDRVRCWLDTLTRLGEVHHYQANMAAVRSIMELTVDLAYLRKDPSMNDQMIAFEQSVRLETAERRIEHLDKGKQLFMSEAKLRAFVREFKTMILAMREKYFDSKHPSTGRWTGRTFKKDVGTVHGYFPYLNLERRYMELNAFSCWSVHGSALMMTRGNTDAVKMGLLNGMVRALYVCGEQSLNCIRLTLEILGRVDQYAAELAEVSRRWNAPAPR